MADGIYIGMSGAAARTEQLDSVADNLANSQTIGFKASRPAFESFLAPGGQGQLAFTAAVDTGIDLRPGATSPTGRPADVVPDDGAFLSVALGDGTVGYTRDGRLRADASGQLLAGAHPVLGADGQPLLIPPGAAFTIDSRGLVKTEGQEVGQLALVRLEGAMERRGDSVLAPVASRGGSALAVQSTLRVGELELSNAGPLEAAVQMISTQRNHDTSMQAIQTYRRLDEQANALGRTK